MKNFYNLINFNSDRLIMKQENSQLIAVAIILIGMILIIMVPLVVLNGSFSISSINSEYAFFIILFIGVLFIIFLAVLLAIKQRRNIWG